VAKRALDKRGDTGLRVWVGEKKDRLSLHNGSIKLLVDSASTSALACKKDILARLAFLNDNNPAKRGFLTFLKYEATRLGSEPTSSDSDPLCSPGTEFLRLIKLKATNVFIVMCCLRINLAWLRRKR